AGREAHALGASQDVLVVKVVERPARSAELLEARHGSGFGGESVGTGLPLAEARGGLRRVVRVRPVQAAINLGHLVAQVADLEVAPHAVVLATARLEVELAEGRRHLLRGAVVAERRVVKIWVEAAVERIGRVAEEEAGEVLHLA